MKLFLFVIVLFLLRFIFLVSEVLLVIGVTFFSHRMKRKTTQFLVELSAN